MAEEPPSLPVGTGVSAKYKGAFCEAKIRKVVRSVKCKVLFKNGLGNFTVCDDQVKGTIRNGSVVEVRHPEKKEFSEATITKIQDCSQYTVVFDDGDITTLRRTALCLKSGKHFAESETLDQLPLTHPEHFSTPVIGGRRGRRARVGVEASSDEEASFRQSTDFANFKETDIGRVICVEGGEKRKNRENWFPGLIVAPTAQESVPIRVRDEYLVRSFKDGRYYTVPKKEILEFSREMVSKSETNSSLKSAVEKAIQFMDRDELPLHWDRDLLFYGVTDPGSDSGEPGEENESSDDEPREKKDHFVAQLYKFMDENGTPINEEPVIGSKDVDLFRLYKVVTNLGGFNRITNQNNWKNVSVKLGFGHNPVIVGMVKQSYRKYLLSFEEWPKRPGCSMQIQPRLSRSRSRIGRNTVVKDRPTTPSVKNEKEKVMEKNSPAVSEPKPGPSGIIKEPPLIKPPITPVVKDKPATKRTAQHATPPTLVKAVGDTYVKTPLKEIKVEPGLKLRNPKQKQAEPESLTVKQEIKQEIDNQASGAIGEAVIAAVKDKKKRVGAKEKPKKDMPLVKGGKVDCLANTRQKRTIKERLKGVAETVKVRGKASLAGIAEIVEKVHPSKSKVKDEGTTTKINKKEEVVPVSAASEEKRKGRKRKEKSEITLEELLFSRNYDVLPTYKTISLGDKLKVYYGPTKEAKITSYEAKVLQTKEENGETLYFVHYTGWNTRYDEWIRASRIADNLSWVAGKASKKQSQLKMKLKKNKSVAAPKSAKREKKSTKNENLKGDYNKAGTNKDVAGTSSASGSSLSSSKDNRSNRQGSVGRSTTPSSIASSSSRSKGTTHKRPATRAAQTRKGSTGRRSEVYFKIDDETTQDFESDGGSELEDSKNITVINTDNLESNTSFQSRNKNPVTSSKDEILPDVGITIKVEELETSHIEIKDVSSLAPMCDVDLFKSEPIHESFLHHLIVKSEDDTEEDDNTRAEDDAREDEDFEELTRITIVKEEPLSEEPVEEDHSSNIATAPDYEAPTIKEEEVEEEDEEEEYDDGYSKSRSGSDNSYGGEESAPEETVLDSIKTEVKIEDECTCDDDLKQPSDVVTKEVKEVAVTVTSNDTDTEDVYEFKEPEPFEFEARKSSDDKGKAVKRAITLSADDKPPSPKMKRSLSPAESDTGLKSSSFETPADLLKDDTSPESTPTIQTCEEAFDKICASPLRAAALDSRHMAMLERMANYDDDDDNFDDDSEDRLVISERDSDNCSNVSFDKDSEILAAEYSNSATEVNELKPSPQHDSQSKEPFPKGNDDDDDEEMEDEAINNAIQTAMHLETSEDSSEEEMIPNEDNTVSMTEVESVKMEENDSSSEMQDLKNSPSNDEENKADDNSGTDESPPHLIDETEKDRIEASIEQEDDTQKESDAIDICPAAEAVEENITAKEEDGGGMIGDLNNSENADVEEDENNIESLICEETIPGSPPSHLEVLHQIEEKHQTPEQGLFKSERDLAPSGNLNEPDAAQQLVQVVRVERSPPTTPESDAASSSRSPLPREPEANAPLLEKKAEKEAVVVKPAVNESSQYKKESTKTSATESRSKKVEVKAPAKRGRKSKKKNDDSGPRRKYSRHSKHHGSESDDTYDPTGGSGRGESSRSRSSPHLYHHNFLIPTDKLSALDVSQRIVHINQAMQELRTTYNNQKTELAAIDKRRKRIRRREREDAARLVNARSH